FCIDLYETDGLLLFRPKSIIRKTIDLERVIENAENIYYFYLDSNWEFEFIGLFYRQHNNPSTPIHSRAETLSGKESD
ncbi:MAG: hypothetical protein II819_08180, partial [Fibrobacter sp.]|nr:hypothetical protein [Fibrobacter sp.]